MPDELSNKKVLFLVALLLTWPGSLCLSQDSETPELKLQKISAIGLPNLIQVNSKIYTGGLPDVESGFAALKRLGVRTIISVDGARPNIEQSQKYGLRYVHLPHGYDGISEARATELAMAAHTIDGPIYIHCHHGKHRSPAAAAVACRALGWIDQQQALKLLALAGTDTKYRGLFQSVQYAVLQNTAELDKLELQFPSVAATPPMIQSMVEIDQLFEQLLREQKQGWKTEPESFNSLIDTAVLLKEQFRELLRIDDPRNRHAEFIHLTKQSEDEAELIHRNLVGRSLDANKLQLLSIGLSTLEANCKSCHQRSRD